MSGSPVVSLRRLQSVVFHVTGRHVASLELATALLDFMDSGSFRFERTSLNVYRDRLRNWQIADSLILAAWERERPKHDRPLRTARLDVPALYESYVAKAKEAGVVPFAFITFRIRLYELTLSAVANEPKENHVVCPLTREIPPGRDV